MPSSNPIHVAIAGSTKHSLMIAKSLANNQDFLVSWVLTPSPKKVGRKQELINNPLHQWAVENKINFQLVDEKVNHISENFSKPDFLLVVDFGYIIPEWLLKFPKVAPINLHPSALPRWRGSSPGQLVILSGEKQSAISLIKLTQKLDAGPIIAQEEFVVDDSWTSADYYLHAFKLASKQIASWISNYHQGKLLEKPQPVISPTSVAKKITKDDAFIDWRVINNLSKGLVTQDYQKDTADALLNRCLNSTPREKWPDLVERARRAFQPWPILWTKIPTKGGYKRMQIIKCEVAENQGIKILLLQEVKIEGMKQANWNQVKNVVVKIA